MERYSYDLGHNSIMAGEIGRLMTLTQIPVVAGDSLEINLNAVFKLSPLRRSMTLDCVIDLVAMYMPLRHVYPQWDEFIKQGYDETITFPSGPAITQNIDPQYLGYGSGAWNSGTMPLWIPAMYNRVWNRYFRHPSDDTTIKADDYLAPTNTNELQYGFACCKPKVLTTTGLAFNKLPEDSDAEVAITSGTFDIRDLDQIRGQYKTEVDRSWFGQRYNDILQKTWGSGVNIDADERPELIARRTTMLSGKDIDGTGSTSLGQYSGKGTSAADLYIPRKFFPEHGAVAIYALLRFPFVHERETHWLAKKVQPTYEEWSGDPEIIANRPPISMEQQNVFGPSNSNSTMGAIPYAQWLRTQPSVIHGRYDLVDGYPTIERVPANFNEAIYYQNDDYNDCFQTTQLGHWQMNGYVGCTKLSVVPPAVQSIYSGAE